MTAVTRTVISYTGLGSAAIDSNMTNYSLAFGIPEFCTLSVHELSDPDTELHYEDVGGGALRVYNALASNPATAAGMPTDGSIVIELNVATDEFVRDITGGNVQKADTQRDVFTQLMIIAMQSIEGRFNSAVADRDMGGFGIVNLKDGTAAQDAVTKAQLDAVDAALRGTYLTDVQAASTAATTASNTATTKAAEASSSASSALSSSNTATAQANTATEKATAAQDWATRAEDDPVPVASGGDGSTTYSAYHWAQKAAGIVASGLADGSVTFAKLNAGIIADQATAEAGTATDKLMTAERTAQAIAALASSIDGAGTDAIAYGNGASATSTDSIAFGTNARGWSTNAIAIGEGTLADATRSIAIGYNVYARGSNAVAAGYGANCTSGTNGTVAMGTQTDSTANQAASFGDNAGALAIYATAIGAYTEVNNTGGTAIGANSESNHDYSTAVGYATLTDAANQIMLGRASEHVKCPNDLYVENDLFLGGVNINTLLGGGTVKSINFSESKPAVSSTSATFVDASGTVTVTPQSTASKFIVLMTGELLMTRSSGTFDADVRVMRGGTAIETTYRTGRQTVNVGTLSHLMSIACQDAPNTTSAVSYKAQVAVGQGAGTVEMASGNGHRFLMVIEYE